MPGSGLLRSLQESDGVNLPRSGFVQQRVSVNLVCPGSPGFLLSELIKEPGLCRVAMFELMPCCLGFSAVTAPGSSFVISACKTPLAHDHFCLSPKHLGLQAGLRCCPGAPGSAPTDLGSVGGWRYILCFCFRDCEMFFELCHP